MRLFFKCLVNHIFVYVNIWIILDEIITFNFPSYLFDSYINRTQLLESEGNVIWITLAITIIIFVLIISIFWKYVFAHKLSELEIHRQKQITQLRELQKLRQELERRQRELASSTLQIIQKNCYLRNLEVMLKDLSGSIIPKNKPAFEKIRMTVYNHFNSEKYWADYKLVFNELNKDFFYRIRKIAPNLSPAELKLAALLRLNLTSKEIADILGISSKSVKTSRSRLRKKLNLERKSNLVDFMMTLSNKNKEGLAN